MAWIPGANGRQVVPLWADWAVEVTCDMRKAQSRHAALQGAPVRAADLNADIYVEASFWPSSTHRLLVWVPNDSCPCTERYRSHRDFGPCAVDGVRRSVRRAGTVRLIPVDSVRVHKNEVTASGESSVSRRSSVVERSRVARAAPTKEESCASQLWWEVSLRRWPR